MDQFSSSSTKNQGNFNDLCCWAKPRNSRSRFCGFSTEDSPHVHLYNGLSVLEVDHHSTGLLKHVKNKVKPLVGKTESQKRKT
jgi:hypothetical protein